MTLILVSAALGGAALGSFATLLIHRLHFDEPGILWGRSQCPSCEVRLSWGELVPVLSWMAQGGKCRHCRTRISWWYPVTELLFVTTYMLFVWQFWGQEILIPLLIIIFFTLVFWIYDGRYGEVDRRLTIPAIVFACVWAFFREESWQLYIAGAGVGFLFYFVQFFCSKGRWVGEGDMDLGLFMGLVLGWKLVLLGLLFAYILGLVCVLPLLFTGKKGLRSSVPMGLFLMPSLLLFLLEGETIWQWYWGLIG